MYSTNDPIIPHHTTDEALEKANHNPNIISLVSQYVSIFDLCVGIGGRDSGLGECSE
jgi:hypothetical protein